MPWSKPQLALPLDGRWSELDAGGASGPCVLETAGGRRLWYTGNDGSTARVLAARRAADGSWERLGVAVEPGLAGETDEFGVEAPSVVHTPGGYLMAYAGSDGANTRLHMASSPDGEHWSPQGVFLQRESEDAVGATDPSLVVANGWWLFYAGYDGSLDCRRAQILAAVSQDGASWDRLGVVLEPEPTEVAVTEPSVLSSFTGYEIFYVTETEPSETAISIATSSDGLNWSRRGTTVGPDHAGYSGIHSPCPFRNPGGQLQLWFAARESSSPLEPERLLFVERE